MKQERGVPSGFSLLELVVAMAVTLIISGAIYGLLAGGQTAFRREPALTDRQQNIRVAMDMIMRDLASAGVGMPGFIQSFTQGLNNCGSCPVAPTSTTERTDDIEVIANPGNNDPEPSCHYPGGNSSNVRLYRSRTSVTDGQIFLVFLDNGGWTMRQSSGTGNNQTAAGDCPQGTQKTQINFAPGASNLNISGGICANGGIGNADDSSNNCAGGNNNCCQVNSIGAGEVVGYRVRETAGVRNLERRASGSMTGNFGANDGWQVVARNIDDMQVEYRNGTGRNGTGWDPDPGQVSCNPGGQNFGNCTVKNSPTSPYTPPTAAGYQSLVREVRVTLSARTDVANIQGMTQPVSGQAAVRGRLTQVTSIRSALKTLSEEEGATPTWQ